MQKYFYSEKVISDTVQYLRSFVEIPNLCRSTAALQKYTSSTCISVEILYSRPVALEQRVSSVALWKYWRSVLQLCVRTVALSTVRTVALKKYCTVQYSSSVALQKYRSSVEYCCSVEVFQLCPYLCRSTVQQVCSSGEVLQLSLQYNQRFSARCSPDISG